MEELLFQHCELNPGTTAQLGPLPDELSAAVGPNGGLTGKCLLRRVGENRNSLC